MRLNGLNGTNETDNRMADAITALAGEMDAIKRLLVLLLMKGGAPGTEIARALDVNKSTISRQFRFGDVEPFVTRTQNGEEEK